MYLETKRLRTDLFTAYYIELALKNKERLAEALGVTVPPAWPNEDLRKALPFLCWAGT